MSRSFKKNPILKDNGKGAKYGKRFANKRVRHSKDVGTGKSSFKHLYESYDIHDWVSRWTKEQAIEAWNNEAQTAERWGLSPDNYGWHKKYKTLENFLNRCWAKYHKRK